MDEQTTLADRLYPVVLEALTEGLRVHGRYSKTAEDIVYAVMRELSGELERLRARKELGED